MTSWLRGRQVVMLSSVDWDSAWQRHQALAEAFTQAGAEVFFVENTGFRGPQLQDVGRVFRRLGRWISRTRRRTGCKVLAPFTLPPTRTCYRAANTVYFAPLLARRLRRLGLKSKPVVFAYLPTPTTLAILDQLDPCLTVYDCVDNFAGHPSPPADLAATEGELLRRSHLVLTTSRFLYEAKAKLHPRVLELHHGVSPDFFLDSAPSGNYGKFCYFGTVWSALDYAPIKALAEAGFSVTLIGPVKEKPPALPPSVRFEPSLPHKKLPQALSGFDALLLPYTGSAYNQGVIPAKMYECLATGLPVLASPLPSLKALSRLIYVADTPSGFVRAARDLARTESREKVRARVAEAKSHSTGDQVRKIERAMEQALDESAEFPAQPSPLYELARAFLHGFSWIAVFFSVARAATVFIQFLAAHFLGPVQYGHANLIVAVASLVQIVPMLGFPLTLARFGAAEQSDSGRRRVVSTTLLVFLIWSSLCLGAFLPASAPLARAARLDAEAWAWALAYGFATAGYLVIASSLQGLIRFKQRGGVEALYGLVSVAVLVLLLGEGHRSYHVLIFSLSFGLVVAALYGLWILRPYIQVRIDRSALSSLMPYALLGTIQVLSAAFIQAPGRIIVFHFNSPGEAGIYAVYFTATAQVALALAYMVYTVLVPLTSRTEGQEQAWAQLRRLAPTAAVGLPLFFAACALAALFLLRHSYPVRWDWLALFSVSGALILMHGVMSALFAARDLHGLFISSAGTLTAGVGNLVFNLALTPLFGVTGAAAALALGYLLGLAWYLVHQPGQVRGAL